MSRGASGRLTGSRPVDADPDRCSSGRIPPGGCHSREISTVYVAPFSPVYGPDDSPRTKNFTCRGLAVCSRETLVRSLAPHI